MFWRLVKFLYQKNLLLNKNLKRSHLRRVGVAILEYLCLLVKKYLHDFNSGFFHDLS